MAVNLYRRASVPIFWVMTAIVYVLATMPLPIEATLGAGDKLNHMAAFLTLTLLGRGAYARSPRWKLVAGLAIFGALIEVTQAIPALHRDADLSDWIADCAAVLAGLAVALPFERRRAARLSA